MFGLKMKKEYIDDILSGRRKTDVRSYNTPVNEEIALINSKNGKVYGYAKIIGSRFISYKEYVLWHVNDYFTIEKALNYYKLTCNKKGLFMYYEYLFEDVKVIEKPFKPIVILKHFSWVKIDDN